MKEYLQRFMNRKIEVFAASETPWSGVLKEVFNDGLVIHTHFSDRDIFLSFKSIECIKEEMEY